MNKFFELEWPKIYQKNSKLRNLGKQGSSVRLPLSAMPLVLPAYCIRVWHLQHTQHAYFMKMDTIASKSHWFLQVLMIRKYF